MSNRDDPLTTAHELAFSVCQPGATIPFPTLGASGLR
jgi:hypothetical protein